MKRTIGLIAICLSIAVTALPAFAQQPTASPAATATATAQNPQCTPESKLAWYNDFRANFKTDQAKANELAKKWLACPEGENEQQITPYLRNFVTLYEKQDRKNQVTDLVYVKKDYPKAVELGRQVLAEEPDNLKILIDLAYAGFGAAAAKNEAYNADAINYAKKAIQLIESGKKLDNWNPYADANEALAYLNNIAGQLTLQKNPADALPYLLKVATLEGKLKKQPFTFVAIAKSYEAGPYAKQSEEYKKIFANKDETPESKLALENINQIVDRMIDAYARAVALATDPAQAASKTEWMNDLGTWYEYRNKSKDGLDQLIAGILAKPLPPVPTPITTLPAATPASTPTSNASGTNPGNVATSPGTRPATPATSPGATGTPAPKPNDATKTPTATPTPKPKMKRNHRG